MRMANYLKLRNGVYYYWRRIPADVLSAMEENQRRMNHIKSSLRTGNKEEASLKAAHLSVWWAKYFELIRSRCYSFDEIEKLMSGAPFKIREVFTSKEHGKPEDKTVLELYELYETERIRADRWRDKTRKDQQQMIRLFVELIGGDCPIGKITRAQLLEIREKICRLPPNLTKVERFRGRSLQSIIAAGDFKPMSTTRAYRIISHVRAFFRWIHHHGLVETDISSGLAMAKRRDLRQDEERTTYSEDDIRRLLASPLFKGEESSDRPENLFITIIGMYSGMRLNEIAQLYVEDVQEKHGIHYFDINDRKNKSLKNPQSRRLLPIHPCLIDIGFLRYVELARQLNMPRLWMRLSYRENSYGKMFSAVFQRLNRKYVTKDRRKVFHSFRHCFASQLKEKGVQPGIIEGLLGHTHGSISLDRYGKAYSLQTLYEAIKKIQHPVPMQQLRQAVQHILASLIKEHPFIDAESAGCRSTTSPCSSSNS